MAKNFEIRKVKDGEGRDAYGLFMLADDSLAAVWDKRKTAEADMRDLEAAIAADAERENT